MKEETKESIRKNAAFIVYAVVIIAAIFFSDLTGIPMEDVSLPIFNN